VARTSEGALADALNILVLLPHGAPKPIVAGLNVEPNGYKDHGQFIM
jgi:hypothetical protein